MYKNKDISNNIDIASVLINYLKAESTKFADVEKLMIDDRHAEVVDAVMRNHWDSIPLIETGLETEQNTHEKWMQIKRQIEIELPKKYSLKACRRKVFYSSMTAAIVFLAIATYIYQMLPQEMMETVISPNVAIDVPADSLHRKQLKERFPEMKLTQTRPAFKIQLPQETEYEEWEEHVTGTGETLDLLLPDGSVVKIYENTQILENVSDSVRAVTLQGKAFFAIAPHPDVKFHVSTSNVSVEVSGTEFEISSYANAEQSVVRVERGKVKVATPNNVKFTLSHNQILTYDNKSRSVSIMRNKY